MMVFARFVPTDITYIRRAVHEKRITAPFNNMLTIKFKAQSTNAFFATINQIFGGSYQLRTTAEHAVNRSLSRVQTTKQCSAVVGSCEEAPNI